MDHVEVLESLKPGSKVYLIGICGTAMASLAGLFRSQGFVVSGSDMNFYPPMSDQLKALQIECFQGYSSDHIVKARPDFVIVGNVVSRDNPEVLKVQEEKIPYTSMPRAIGSRVIGNRQSVVISGTHGKTTTTSLMAWVLEYLNLKPGFMIGGIAKNFARSFEVGEGDYFVIEGDEYDTAFFDKVPKFIHYRPSFAVITSIEFDHADIYKDLEEIKKAFLRLIHLVPKDGLIVYHGEDANIKSLIGQACCKCISYGFHNTQVKAKVIAEDEAGIKFQVFFESKFLGEFALPLSGSHNVLNALSVIALSFELGLDMEKIKEAFLAFKGVKRRGEVIGEPRGITVVEDFAHHPTAVRETLLGLKKKYKERKLVAVFEPRSASSRRRVFQKDYVKAFSSADEVVLAEAFDQSKINEADRFSSSELCRDLESAKTPARSFVSTQHIVDYLADVLRPEDVVVIMSNGGFDGIYQKLIDRLS